MRAYGFPFLIAALTLLVATCTMAGAAYYNPAKTVIVFIGGFDPNGHHYTGVYGDDYYDPLMETMGQMLGAPTWQTNPTAPNQVAATTYYGATPPAWYTAQDVADVNAQADGIPRYAMRVAKYIRHVLQRAPTAQAVNLISGSMGCEVARYMIEHDFCQLASTQKIARWAPVVGVICGAWPATYIAEWFANLLGMDTSAPEVQHMKYPWVDSNISARTTMNTALYGPMLIQQFISTRDSDGYFTTIANIPNDCTLACEDEYFWGYTTANALHTATDGTKQMPGRVYSRTNHYGIASNPAMWVNYVAFSKGTTRVTITLTRVTAKTSGDPWYLGDGDWVFESQVTSPRAASQFGCTTPLSEINKDDGVAPCYRFGNGQTKYPNAVLFDQVVLPGETTLKVRFWVEELDWFTQYYSMWEPGSNVTMGDWTFNVSATSDSTRTFSNGNMEADLQIKVRQTHVVAPNVPPTAGFSYTPTTPTTQDTIQFTSNSTDTDGQVVRWSWDFGDGSGTSLMAGSAPAAAPLVAGRLVAGDDTAVGDDSVPASGEPVTDGTSNLINPDGVAAWGTSEVAYVEPGLDTYPGPDPNNPYTEDPNGGAVPVTETTYVEDLPDDGSAGTLSAAPLAAAAAPLVEGLMEAATIPNPTHRYADDGTYTVTLTVWDDEGATAQKVKTITVLNVAPTAKFSFSPAAPTDLDTITFTNNSTDVDGTIATCLWNFGDGSTSTDLNPTHKYADDGTYTVTLTVTDDDGAVSAPKVKQVVVTNVAPEAGFNLSPTAPTDLDTITFTDTSTDADGTVASWAWDFGDGATATTQSPTHKYADNGTYTVTLKVTDDDGDTDTASMQVVVKNVPPEAGFGFAPTAPTDLDTVTFTDTSTDADGTVASWAWDFGDGATATTQSPTHKYADNGTYTVTLTVTDNDGDSDTATMQVVVKNVPPEAGLGFSPAAPTDLDTVTFTDTSTDADGTVASWAWDFGDGATATTQNPTHQYADDGKYTVTLTVTDNDGDTDTATREIEVLNVAPTAAFDLNPTTPTTQQAVAFSDGSSDADGSISSWNWDLGDGSTSTERNPSHQYGAIGSYQVKLTVTDDDGATATVTKNVRVIYTWLGFLPPLDGSHQPFKAGSTIPIKFRICTAAGPVTDAVATVSVFKLADGAPTGDPIVVSTANGDVGNQFRYSALDDLYIFNMSTKGWQSPATYRATVTLNDGSAYSVDFATK